MWLLPLHCHLLTCSRHLTLENLQAGLHSHFCESISFTHFTFDLSCFSYFIFSHFKLATHHTILSITKLISHVFVHRRPYSILIFTIPTSTISIEAHYPYYSSPIPTPQLTTPVVWKITPLFATWLSSPSNPLSILLTPTTTILELGAGVSAIVALALAPLVARYTATDQDYVLKFLRQNVAENLDAVFPKARAKKAVGNEGRIRVEALDWEKDDVRDRQAVDVIVACDCIYNESLIEPLNSTCAALCRLRAHDDTPTVCLIAQQLRSPDVFEAWLKSFHEKFEVWQVPDSMLGEGLKEGSGFVVHVGIVR